VGLAMSALQPGFVLAGFAVGILVGLTGVGGGSLMTPLLILFFGLHPTTAVGTDLLFAATTKSAGTWVHGLNQTIDWRVVGRLAAGSVPMTVLTMIFLSKVNIASEGTTDLITVVLAFALIITACSLVFRTWLLARYSSRIGNIPDKRVLILTVVMGGILGVLVTLTSVGAGAIGITALILLYPQLPTARIVGSDIAHAVPLTFVAGIGHWFLGSTDLGVFISLILGSVPGIFLSSHLAPRVPEMALRILLAGILFIVAVKLSVDVHHHAWSNGPSVSSSPR
jgi:uncharacterized membrane protein YfcA